MITINTIPFLLTDKQKSDWTWRMKQRLANESLRHSLTRDMEQNIPIEFLRDIVLTVSIRKTDLRIVIDYSKIGEKETIKLIKSYLSGDKEGFANRWVTLYKY